MGQFVGPHPITSLPFTHTVLCPPPQINTDPYGEGWMVKVKLSNPEELKELMSAKEYEEFCA